MRGPLKHLNHLGHLRHLVGAMPRSSAVNIFGDRRVALTMNAGTFTMLDIGNSISSQMAYTWPLLFNGAVPFGGITLSGFNNYFVSQGWGTSADASLGTGGNFLPTSNYSLKGALELKSNGTPNPAGGTGGGFPPNRISEMIDDWLLDGRTTKVYGGANWLSGSTKVRGMYYGCGTSAGQTIANIKQNIWGDVWDRDGGTVVPARPAGSYYAVDFPCRALSEHEQIVPFLEWASGTTPVNNALFSVMLWRIYRDDPHWGYFSIARGASTVDNYISAEYSAEAYAGVLPIAGITLVRIAHGFNESNSLTKQQFKDKLLTLIGLCRQDDPNRMIMLVSQYAVPGGDADIAAKLLRNALAMREISQELPLVLFIDQNAELPDGDANNAYLVDGVHPTTPGNTYFRNNEIAMIRRAAAA